MRASGRLWGAALALVGASASAHATVRFESKGVKKDWDSFTSPDQVTEVTSETTELPASATNTPQPTTPSTSPPPPQPLPTAEPVPVPEPPPPAPSPAPAASQSTTGQPPPFSAGGTEAPEAAAG